MLHCGGFELFLLSALLLSTHLFKLKCSLQDPSPSLSIQWSCSHLQYLCVAIVSMTTGDGGKSKELCLDFYGQRNKRIGLQRKAFLFSSSHLTNNASHIFFKKQIMSIIIYLECGDNFRWLNMYFYWEHHGQKIFHQEY